jgi:lysophospholipase L1-like esterase
MGLGASQRGNTIHARLQENLRRSSGTEVEVLNCAVGDYTTSQSLLYLLTELIELQPDAIISLDGFNDFSHSTWGTKYSKGKWLPNTTRSFDDGLEAILTWDGSLEHNSIAELERRRSARAIRAEVRRWSRSGQHGQLTRASHGFIWDDPQTWSVKTSGIDWYLRNLASTAFYCAGAGVSYLQIIQPAMLWPTANPFGPTENSLLGKFNDRMPRLSELCESYYAQLVPRYSDLARSLSGGGPSGSTNITMVDGTGWLQEREQEMYFDPMHYNDLGQIAVADRIAAEVHGQKWLD